MPARTTTTHMRTVTKHATASNGQAPGAASMISVAIPHEKHGSEGGRPIFKKFLEYGARERTFTA